MECIIKGPDLDNLKMNSQLRIRYFLDLYLGGSIAFGGVLGFCLGYRQLRYNYQNSGCFQGNSLMVYVRSLGVLGESVFTGMLGSVLSSLLLHIPTLIFLKRRFLQKRIGGI